MNTSAIQRWLQAAIVGPHEGAPDAARDAARVVLPSSQLAPRERVNIYSRMYFARLLECIEEDYPAVRRHMGHDKFERLARAYLEAHPSRHYSLNVLGRLLPVYLQRRGRSYGTLTVEMARLECAMSEAFDAEEASVLTAEHFRTIDAGVWPDIRLPLAAGVKLLGFEHRVNAIVTALRRGTRPPSRRHHRTWVAVHRRGGTVWRSDLSAVQYELLCALRDGRSVRQAIRRALQAARGRTSSLEVCLFRWFRQWVAEGFFEARQP